MIALYSALRPYNYRRFFLASLKESTDAGYYEKVRIYNPNHVDRPRSPSASSPGAEKYDRNNNLKDKDQLRNRKVVRIFTIYN
jgi:hypothetical protein